MCPNLTMTNGETSNINNHKQVSRPARALVWIVFGVCANVQLQLDRLCLKVTRGQPNKLLMINAFVQVNKLSNMLTLIEGAVYFRAREMGSLSFLVKSH